MGYIVQMEDMAFERDGSSSLVTEKRENVHRWRSADRFGGGKRESVPPLRAP